MQNIANVVTHFTLSKLLNLHEINHLRLPYSEMQSICKETILKETSKARVLIINLFL